MTKSRKTNVRIGNRTITVPSNKTGNVSNNQKRPPKNGPLTMQTPQKLISSCADYAAARLSPFSQDAPGAKVPDLFGAHTVTQTLKASVTVVPSSTTCDIVVWPNLKMAMTTLAGTLSSASTFTCGDNSGTIQYFGWSSSSLKARMTNYRIVGMGVRVTSTAAMTAGSGRVVIGTLPLKGTFLGKSFQVGGVTMDTNSSLTKAVTVDNWGLPASSGVISANLLSELPDSKVFSVLELAENQLEIIPNLSSPDAFNFRLSDDAYSGTDIAYQSATGNSGNADYIKFGGFEACVIALDGGTTSTPLEIEVIYHIEGAPATSGGISGGVSSVFPSGSARSPVAPALLDKVNMTAGLIEPIRFVATEIADMIHPTFGRIARAIL